MKIFFFITFFIHCGFLFSQEIINDTIESTRFDIEKHKLIYQISFASPPESIELMETNNGEIKGFIGLVLRRHIDTTSEKFVSKMPIDSQLVKELISELKKIGIETVKDCNENIDCKYGLDGDDVYYNVYTDKIQRNYSFWELHPNDIIEISTPENRKQAQEILNVLDKKLNFKNKFHEIKGKLPKGKYSYSSGYSIALFEIIK